LVTGLGSTMAITDDIGDVVRDYTYDVYGRVAALTGEPVGQAALGLLQLANNAVDGGLGANGHTKLAEWAAYLQSGDHGGHC